MRACFTFSSIFRFDRCPRSPCTINRISFALQLLQQRRTDVRFARSLRPPPFCVISPFFAFCNATSLSRSFCVMRSVPESTSPH